MWRISSCDLTFRARFILFINVLSQRFQSSLKLYDCKCLKIKYFSFLIVKKNYIRKVDFLSITVDVKDLKKEMFITIAYLQ